MEGSIIDAIRDVEPIANTRDFKYSASVALHHYYSNYSASDENKLQELDTAIYRNEICPPSDQSNAARFFLYLQNYSKLATLLEKLKDNPDEEAEHILVKGWYLAGSPDEAEIVHK